MGVYGKRHNDVRHWSAVDLWSDGPRHRSVGEAPHHTLPGTAASLRIAEVGLDIPLQFNNFRD